MAVFNITQGASNASGLIINAVNRLRQAKAEVEMANAVIQNMTDQQITDQTGFTGTGAQLKATLAGVEAALNDTDVENFTELLNW